MLLDEEGDKFQMGDQLVSPQHASAGSTDFLENQ